MEWAGVPLDTPLLRRLEASWDAIKERLVEEIDRDFGVYEGRTFKEVKFAALLEREGIPWPRLESGRLSLSSETFRSVSKSHPRLFPLYELRHNLGKMRLNELQVGQDGRNRAWLKPFGTRTARNAPSNTKFIFGPSVWLRGLIKPEPGHGIAYIDWEQQEFGIAAVLSGDPAMLEAYHSGDPYLAFAKQAGDIPPEGTKVSHPGIRNLYKQCVLATGYGQGERGLAERIGKSPAVAHRRLGLYDSTFSRFRKWSETVVNHGMLRGKLTTLLGWHAGFSMTRTLEKEAAETVDQILEPFPIS